MKDLKQKVIELGIERGYLPKHSNDNVIENFKTQYLRLKEAFGEASKEVRKGTYKDFQMELGDVLVLQTNCNYIVAEYLPIEDFRILMDNSRDSIDILTRISQTRFNQEQSNYHRDKQCLQMAYNKIVKRGGMLIGEDWFKPTDKEYQQAKLYQLKERLIDALTINPKYEVYRDKLKEIYSELHYLNYINLDEDDVKLIIALEAEIEMSIGELNKKEI